MYTNNLRIPNTASFCYFQDRSRQCDRIIKNVDRPCQNIVPVSDIRTTVSDLTDAICRLYERWEANPMVVTAQFHSAIFALVGRLKWLTKDLNGTTGTCDQLVLLVKEYDECREEYKRLMVEFEGEWCPSAEPTGAYFNKATRSRLFKN